MSGCWLWTGAASNGYGQIRLSPAAPSWAHRVVFETFVGPIPTELELDHLCRNTMCVNPVHLEPVTHLENMHRSPFLFSQHRS